MRHGFNVIIPPMLSTFISIKTRMPDLCTDIWNYAFTLRAAPDKSEAVKGKMAQLFRLLDKQARMAGAEQADVQQAKFALCAYVDEIAMAGLLANAWVPLCKEYFGEANAGEGFFTRLESLRHSSETRKRDLLEVFYMCLALGFQGRYGDMRGAEKRKVLLDGICRELRSEGAKRISVQLTSPDKVPGPRRIWPRWALPLCCTLAVGALYAGLAFALSRLAQ